MPDAPLFQPLSIEEADIGWACRVMGLPVTAFAGADGTDPRLAVLKSMETLDIEACPGSGKTTLLVAKLAILANRWPYHRHGVCVLSHTNAARNEIETKLSSCSAGIALLRYPHFVGTIHSFVNEFLAVPWLRSLKNPIKAIDTDIALNVRWSKVPGNTKTYLRKQNRDKDKYWLTYDRVDFGGGDKRSLGEHTPTYKALMQICKETSRSGYFCYDEMFVWASQLLDSCPHIAEAIRLRFPFVFIDEVQDNSELQSAFLHRVFCSAQTPVRRQRFGDSNQAIYQYAKQSGATTDPFPSPSKTDLPHSFRFGQAIADFAYPLGVTPQRLVGRGPLQEKITAKDKCGVLFFFDDQTILDVLPTYAKYLLETFSTEELAAGLYTAVAGVHESDKVDNPPRFLGHYAPTYDPSISRRDSSPETFIQYVLSGRREITGRAEVYSIVTKTGAAILRLAQLANADLYLARRKNPHRYVLELLETKADARNAYRSLIDHLVQSGGAITVVDWNNPLRPCAAAIAEAIAGVPVTSSDCTTFLEWRVPSADGGTVEKPVTPDNVYRYPPDAPEVHIRLGSIHSVKGETHTATLVLDSYFHDHHLKELKPWLLGVKIGARVGKKTEGVRMVGRLKLHYVAMTRPSHLLCLAMRRDAFDDVEIEALKKRRWHIIDCTTATRETNASTVA